MRPPWSDARALRQYRNGKLYRHLVRTLRVYNRRLLAGLHARGFDDFSPAFPPLLANLDAEGTRVGVLAERAGVTRQAAGQLVREIERCGYVERRASADDARATIVRFTPRGRKLLDAVFVLVEEIEADFASHLTPGEFARTRDALLRLANAVDPVGAFGQEDETPAAGRARPERRPSGRSGVRN